MMRAAAYLWAAPCSAVGLLAALPLWACGAVVRRHTGVLEVSIARRPSRLAAFAAHLPFQAITLGHVVIARSPRASARFRAHEREHVRQCERWGPLFFPAYLAASAWQLLRGRAPYRDNPFEVAARAAEKKVVAITKTGDCA